MLFDEVGFKMKTSNKNNDKRIQELDESKTISIKL